jgi:GT2 family glycosyltransferase/glycosyltransferase involved in cell wall biosynthesis
MPLHRPEHNENVGLARGSVAICMLTRGLSDLLTRCLNGVLVHTPADVPILLMDDCSSDDSVAPLLEARAADFANRDIYFLRQTRSVGFVENMNMLLAMAAPADVLILNDDCEVAAGWFEGLRAAAYSDSVVASATALTNHGSVVSIPKRNTPQGELPDGWNVDSAAAAVRKASKRLYPRLPTIVGHCAYIKRSAIELVGPFDLAFAPGYGEEVDFSQRCLLRGLTHVVADDVFVYHQGSKTFNVRAEKLKADHEALLADRYPFYHGMVGVMATRRSGPLAHALLLASRALTGLSVTIDGSCLVGGITGTQLHILELIQALHRVGGARLRVALPRHCADYALETLQGLKGVELIAIDAVDDAMERTDVVHRPFQLNSTDDLYRLRQMGERVVVTQQDFIAYWNPGYFKSAQEWDAYRRCARLALECAERVVFFSRHAACEAQHEQLVSADRSRVVYIGVDHHLNRQPVEPRRPDVQLDLEKRGYMLSLGVDFVHKNRLFALQVMRQLQERHRWEGCLVLAGPQASPGSSAAIDRAFLRENPDVASATVVTGGVSESEKRWLFEHATLVISPTTYEGFGLIPFEAADAGVPCLFAPQASLAEVLPAELALIEPWNAAATADRAMHLIANPAERDRLVRAIEQTGERYRWDQTGEGLMQVYREAADAPSRELEMDDLGVMRQVAPRHNGLFIRALSKALNWWGAYGLLGGTWHGGTALVRKVARRLRARVLPLRAVEP